MKLLTLLKGLDPEEFRELEKFLQSPFFKASQVYLKFIRHLRKHHSSFELGKADLQQAYHRCFGAENYSEPKLYNLMSGLCRQIEQYMVVRKLIIPESNGLFELLLVDALGARHMNGYFRDEAERQIEGINAHTYPQLDDYQSLQKLHQSIYFDPDTPKFFMHSRHLELADQNLDLHYCLMKLRYAAEMKARERLLNLRYELPMLPSILDYCDRYQLAHERPLLAIYRNLVGLYLDGVDEAGFQKLQEQFIGNFSSYPKTEKAVLLRHLINNGIYLNAQGAQVEPELLDLYRFAIENDLLLSGKRLTHSSFINIANLACLCKEFVWATQFIQDYSSFLEEKIRRPSIGIAMTSWYYNQGMLDEAQECLTPEVFSTLTLELLARGMLLKIAFDRFLLLGKDREFLISHLHAFEKYVSAKQLAPEKKDAELNWIRFVRKMTALKFEHVQITAAQKAKLRDKLLELQPMVNKSWTAGKIEAL